MSKVKLFQGAPPFVETDINEWLEDQSFNPIRIKAIRQSCTQSLVVVSVWYDDEPEENDLPKVALRMDIPQLEETSSCAAGILASEGKQIFF